MVAEPRIPPHSLEAEQSVLGAMFLDLQAVVRASELLRVDDFYREAHRRVFEAALAVFERREPIDLVTMTEELRRRSWLEGVGGITYLGYLAAFVPTAAHTEHYARIVQQKALLRALVASATGIQEMAYSGSEELPALLDRAEQAVFAVTQRGARREHHMLKDVLQRSLDHIEDLYRRKTDLTGIDTGLADLNRLTSGLQPSDFIVIAGRPGHGKTALALCLARHAALESDLPTLVFSLEMSAEQLCLRLLAAEAQVDGSRLRTGRLSSDDWGRLSEAAGRLGSAPLMLDDTPALTLTELRGRARRLRAEHNVGLIVVDYLQLINVPGRHENRQQEISEISRSLKALARELELPVVACSQLSRAVERRGEGSRPQLSDLRESGAIEQDADLVAFIHFDPRKDNRDVADFILAKQRNGPTDSFELYFRRDLSRFESIERRRPAP